MTPRRTNRGEAFHMAPHKKSHLLFLITTDSQPWVPTFIGPYSWARRAPPRHEQRRTKKSTSGGIARHDGLNR